MKLSRTSRAAFLLFIFFAAAGLLSAKVASNNCANDLSVAIKQLSAEHSQAEPVVQTRILAPFLVRASSKVPLLAGHEKYYSRTYLTFFGWIHLHNSTDIYLL